MSYCRFENTLEDLVDCLNNLDDRDLSFEEYRARRKLIIMCARIAENYLCETEEKVLTRAQFEDGAVW